MLNEPLRSGLRIDFRASVHLCWIWSVAQFVDFLVDIPDSAVEGWAGEELPDCQSLLRKWLGAKEGKGKRHPRG